MNDADQLAIDAVMRQIMGGRAVSASRMGRFETETLALPENRVTLADPKLVYCVTPCGQSVT